MVNLFVARGVYLLHGCLFVGRDV